jgi:hypothetical protein
MSEPAQALPEIDFATFILSLASSALVHLGELPEPDAPEGAPNAAPNLPLAKQSIEIIAMLEHKTHGNLDDAERQLVQSVLYDLRVKYVDASKRAR